MTAKEFIYNLPLKVNKDAIAGMETVFHFDVEGEGGGQYTVTLKDGSLKVDEGLIGESKCKVKASNDNLMGVIDGSINPLMALMMGKIKIDHQGELLKYAKIFGLMK